MKSASFLSTFKQSCCAYYKRKNFVRSDRPWFAGLTFASSPPLTAILHAEVEKGTFRRDLYFRLNVITLRLPPLRSRMEDIPDLVDHFLRRYGRGHQMSAEAMEALLSYEWPGNVRQLEHCIQHMVAVNSGPILHAGDLPTMLMNHMSQPTSGYAGGRIRSRVQRQPFAEHLHLADHSTSRVGEASDYRSNALHER